MTIDPAVIRSTASPYGHLAVAPYPEQYDRRVTLMDGTVVVLRPLRPDDEGLWHTMVDAASEQSIMFRFRSLFRSVVHNQAVRYCFIDYDREMAFIAEVEVQGRRELVAVGRLVADRDHDRAEFGILVVDAWQGRGLGGMLLDMCLQHTARLATNRFTPKQAGTISGYSRCSANAASRSSDSRTIPRRFGPRLSLPRLRMRQQVAPCATHPRATMRHPARHRSMANASAFSVAETRHGGASSRVVVALVSSQT